MIFNHFDLLRGSYHYKMKLGIPENSQDFARNIPGMPWKSKL